MFHLPKFREIEMQHIEHWYILIQANNLLNLYLPTCPNIPYISELHKIAYHMYWKQSWNNTQAWNISLSDISSSNDIFRTFKNTGRFASMQKKKRFGNYRKERSSAIQKCQSRNYSYLLWNFPLSVYVSLFPKMNDM